MARNLNDLKQERIVKRYSHYFNTKLDFICNKYLESDCVEDDCVVDLSSLDFKESSQGSVNDYAVHLDQLKRTRATGRDHTENKNRTYAQLQAEDEDDDWHSGEEDESVLQDLKLYMEQEPSDGETLSSTSSHSDRDQMIITYKDIIDYDTSSSSSTDEDYLEERTSRTEDSSLLSESEPVASEAHHTKDLPMDETYIIEENHNSSTSHSYSANRSSTRDTEKTEYPREKMLYRLKTKGKRGQAISSDKNKSSPNMHGEDSESTEMVYRLKTKGKRGQAISSDKNKSSPDMHGEDSESSEMVYRLKTKGKRGQAISSDKNKSSPDMHGEDSESTECYRNTVKPYTNERPSRPDKPMMPEQYHSCQWKTGKRRVDEKKPKVTESRKSVRDTFSPPYSKHQSRGVERDYKVTSRDKKSRIRNRDTSLASTGYQYADKPNNFLHHSSSSNDSIKWINGKKREKTSQITREVTVQTGLEPSEGDHVMHPKSPYERYINKGKKSPRNKDVLNRQDSWINQRIDSSDYRLQQGDGLSPYVRRHNRNTEQKISQTTDGPRQTKKERSNHETVLSPTYSFRNKRREIDEDDLFTSPDRSRQYQDPILEKCSKKDTGIMSLTDDTHTTNSNYRRLSVNNLKAFNESQTEHIEIDISMNQSDLIQVVENENAKKIKRWLDSVPVTPEKLEEEEEDVIGVKEDRSYVYDHEKSTPIKRAPAKTTPRSRLRHTNGPIEKANVSCQTDPKSPRNILSPQPSPYSKAVEHFPAQPKSSKRVFIKVAKKEKVDKSKRRLSSDIGEMMRNVYCSPQRRRLIEESLQASGSAGKKKKRLLHEVEDRGEEEVGEGCCDSVPTPPKSRKTSTESYLLSDINNSGLCESGLRNSHYNQRLKKSGNNSGGQNVNVDQFYNETVNFINSKMKSPTNKQCSTKKPVAVNSPSPQKMFDTYPYQNNRNFQQTNIADWNNVEYLESIKSFVPSRVPTGFLNERSTARCRYGERDDLTEHYDKPDYYQSNEQLSDYPHKHINTGHGLQTHSKGSHTVGMRTDQTHSRGSHTVDMRNDQTHSKGSHTVGMRTDQTHSKESHTVGMRTDQTHSKESQTVGMRTDQTHSKGSHTVGMRTDQCRQCPRDERLLVTNGRQVPVNHVSRDECKNVLSAYRHLDPSCTQPLMCKHSAEKSFSNDLSQYEADLESNSETSKSEQDHSVPRNRLQNFVNKVKIIQSDIKNQRYVLDDTMDEHVMYPRQAQLHPRLRKESDDKGLSRSVEEWDRSTLFYPQQDVQYRNMQNQSLESQRYHNDGVEQRNGAGLKCSRNANFCDKPCYRPPNVPSNNGYNSNDRSRKSDQYILNYDRDPQYENFSPRSRAFDNEKPSTQFQSPNIQRNVPKNNDIFSPSGSLAKLHLKTPESQRKQEYSMCTMSPREPVYQHYHSHGEDKHIYQNHRHAVENRSYDSTNCENNTETHQMHSHNSKHSLKENCNSDKVNNVIQNTHVRHKHQSGHLLRDGDCSRHSMNKQNHSGHSMREQMAYENVSDKENEYRDNQDLVNLDKKSFKSEALPHGMFDKRVKSNVSDRNNLSTMNADRSTTSDRYMQTELSPYKVSYRHKNDDRNSSFTKTTDGPGTKSDRNRKSPRDRQQDYSLSLDESPDPRNIKPSPYRRSESQSFDSAFDGRHSQSSYDLYDSRVNSKVNNNHLIGAKRAENHESNVAHIRKMEVTAKCPLKPKTKKNLFTGTRNVATPVSFIDFAQGISNSGTCEKKSIHPKNNGDSRTDFKMPFSVNAPQNSAVKTSVKKSLSRPPFQPQASYKDSTPSPVSGRRQAVRYRGRGQSIVHSTPLRTTKTAFMLNETLSTIQAPDETENEDDIMLVKH